MGNIYCASCEHKCSDQAAACPKCGHPLVAMAKSAAPDVAIVEQLAAAVPDRPPVVVHPVQQVQTIEKTSKTWKLLQLIGTLLILASLGTCIVRATMQPEDPSAWPVFALLLGVMALVMGRVGGWWYHG